MITANLFSEPLTEFTGKKNRNQHCRATFPLIGAHGANDLATVYIEIEPGDHLGRHTDSAEELLVILEGKVEIEVSGRTRIAESGAIALVPKMEPHNIRNIGNIKTRILGVFGGTNNIVATFEEEWLPIGRRIVDTAQL